MKPRRTGTSLLGAAAVGIVLWLFLGVIFAQAPALAQSSKETQRLSAAQQERLTLMKSRGPEASLTIFPVEVGRTPYERVSEVVALLFERQGLKNIELGKTTFQPGALSAMGPLAGALGEFVKKNPIATEYALYAQYPATPQSGIKGIRAVIVDKMGAVVWTDSLGPNDQAVKNVMDRDPMGFSVLLAERVAPQLGLSEETARGAKPGKFAQLMEERSGLPPESERNAIPPRLKELRAQRKTMTLTVYPARVGEVADPATAAEVAKMLNDRGLCKAAPAPQTVVLKTLKADPNELKLLWDLAREFREYVRSNPPATDYALYADYGLDPQAQQVGFVHSVVCDKKGEWVVVDLQNSMQSDFQSVRPTSSSGCNALLVKRLTSYLKLSASELIREKIKSDGIHDAVEAFHEAQGKPDEYSASEEEINQLGYEYLQSHRYKEAIAVFKLNIEAFPESFNVYDSMGEAYALAGEKELAIENYRKSVQLNPDSQSGIMALKKLEAK